MVTRPKKNMHDDNQMCGFNFFRSKLAGISKSTYGTKNITRAVLYLFPVAIWSSVERPKIFAFEMFTRSRNANKYIIQRNVSNK